MAVKVDDTTYEKATSFAVDTFSNLKLSDGKDWIVIIASGVWNFVEVQ